MRILILGAGGMAGHMITLYLQEQGYDVTAFTRKPITFAKHNVIGDVMNEEVLWGLIKINYDIIINCIGILNTDAENEKGRAVFINSYLPHFICDAIIERKTKLIHMSTDCVFAGNTGPYLEDSLKDGLTFYDRSKALGEVNDQKNLTFRNSIIGPDLNEHGIGLFNWFMQQKNAINGYSGAIWTGVTTLTLAKAMESAIQQDLRGVFNLVNNTNISKYKLLCLFNEYFRNNELEIKKDNLFNLDKSLICTRTDFSFIVPSYEEMIEELKEWVTSHSDIYNFYK